MARHLERKMRNIKEAIETSFYVHADPISFLKMVRVRIKSMLRERENISKEKKYMLSCRNICSFYIYTEVESEKAVAQNLF